MNVALDFERIRTSGENLELIKFVKSRCLLFLTQGVAEIKNRFTFVNKGLFKELSILDPKNVFHHSSLINVLKFFPMTVDEMQLIDNDFRSLKNYEKELVADGIEFDDFWMRVGNIKYGNEMRFQKLINFIQNYIYILPHSSAAVERIFSAVANNKTDKRNQLSTKSLTGILHTKEFLTGSTCYSFPVSDDLQKRFNVQMYNFKTETS